MAHDRKYGQVTLERGTIGEDEPVMVFRAQDALLPELIAYYHFLCMRDGTDMEHLKVIAHRHRDILVWQDEHPLQVKIPDTQAGQVEYR